MRRVESLRAEFVETMPDTLQDGFIYVSERYRIALHNCCCGCGEEVSTPLGATEYTLSVHGDGVTVFPSVGNHDFACRSHYFISGGDVLWADAMSRAAIERGRAHDRELKRPTRPRGIRAVLDWIKRQLSRFLG